jgi:hypothetical protein
MTKDEALTMLANAPRGNEPSRVNPNLTVTQGIEIVMAAIAEYEDGKILPPLMEKRVHQVCKNQRRPRLAA